MDKVTIKNRDDKNIVLVLEKAKNSNGLAIVMHGLGGRKDQSHIVTFSKAFEDKNYTTIRFDVTHSYGESDGDYENANITNYYKDLCDVIKWVKNQDFYIEPFVLVGHSLGGISTAFYAENHPDEIKALAPISTVVNHDFLIKSIPKEELDKYEKTGYRIRPSKTNPNLIKKLNWQQFKNDSLKYDLLKNIDKLTMPILMIVGSLDESTPLNSQKVLFDALSSEKEFHIIDGAPHTFVDTGHLYQIRNIFLKWISAL